MLSNFLQIFHDDLTGASLWAIPVAFLGGTLASCNLCCIPMISAAGSYLGTKNYPSRLRSLLVYASFVLGYSTSMMVMGFLTAYLGWVFGQYFGEHRVAMKIILAFVPVLMGLHLLNIVHVQLPTFSRQIGTGKGILRAFATGSVFAFAITPCATPILVSLLSVISTVGKLGYGILLMFVYGLGSGIPIVLLAAGMGSIASCKQSPAWTSVINKLSGVVLLGIGVYIIWSA